MDRKSHTDIFNNAQPILLVGFRKNTHTHTRVRVCVYDIECAFLQKSNTLICNKTLYE